MAILHVLYTHRILANQIEFIDFDKHIDIRSSLFDPVYRSVFIPLLLVLTSLFFRLRQPYFAFGHLRLNESISGRKGELSH